jgi:outer membrane protein assembly factor BamB
MFHSASFADGRLYVVAQDGALFVLDAGRGTELLQFPDLTGSPLIYGAGSAVPGDGGFYAVLPDGKLHALR